MLAAPLSALAESAHFDIAAQPLPSALRTFAAQADMQLLYRYQTIDGIWGNAVRGDLDKRAALEQLLRGTRLEIVYSAKDAATIRKENEMTRQRPTKDSMVSRGNLMRSVIGNLLRTRRPVSISLLAALSVAGNVALAAEQNAGDALERETLEEVIITAFRARTATKTDIALTETPQSISIITAGELESRGALGLQEGLRYSAGVRTEPNGSDLRFDYITARGFSATDYLDGMVRLDGYYTARTEVYTLERVEVLRGPSSVLYGQGTAGGIVNSITKRPGNEAAAQIGLEFGSFDRKQAQFDVTGPLNASRTVSARLIGVYRDAENQFDFGQDDRIVVAPSLRMQSGEQTDIVFTGLYQKDEAGSVFPYVPVSAALLAPPGGRLPDDVFLGEPSFNIFDREQYHGAVLVQHRFSDRVSYGGGVRYGRSYGHDAGIYGDIWNGVENPFLDPERRLLPRYRYDFKARTGALTSDNRIQVEFRTGDFEHNVLAGIDYSRINLESASAFAVGAGSIDIYAPDYGNVIDAELSPYFEQDSDQLGLYLQNHLRFRDRATLVLGARRDRVSTTLGDAESQVDKETTFRAGLTVAVVEGVTPYVSYSESFIPTIGLDFFNNPFKPQRGIQYEAGVKWQPDRNTLLTLAAFDLKGTNKPQTDPENGSNRIQTGEVQSRGLEFEAIRRLPDDYSVSLSFTHLDMEVSESSDPLEIGLPVSQVPEDQASAWAEKSIEFGGPLAMRLGVGVRYVGPSAVGLVSGTTVERLESPSFTLADAMLGFDWNAWAFTLNVTNLLDERYYGSCSIRTACSIGYRRNVIGRWTYRF